MKLIKLTTDNALKRATIHATVEEIECGAKRIFGWRSATKKYNSIYERVMGLGSSKYDELILEMHKMGY